MAKMTKCKACGSEIAKGAKTCPKCGKDQRSFFGKHKIITGIIVIIIIIVIASTVGGGKGTSASSSSSNSTSSSSSSQDDKKYSYNKFMQIQMGMTYNQVKSILGADGSQNSSTDVGGIKSTLYTWSNDDGGTLSVTFNGQNVDSKSQLALKSMDSNATMAKYNQINTGMSYDQVKSILGDGQLTSEDKIADIVTDIYTWSNSDGSNMNVTIQGGKVDSKTQLNLK